MLPCINPGGCVVGAAVGAVVAHGGSPPDSGCMAGGTMAPPNAWMVAAAHAPPGTTVPEGGSMAGAAPPPKDAGIVDRRGCMCQGTVPPGGAKGERPDGGSTPPAAADAQGGAAPVGPTTGSRSVISPGYRRGIGGVSCASRGYGCIAGAASPPMGPSTPRGARADDEARTMLPCIIPRGCGIGAAVAEEAHGGNTPEDGCIVGCMVSAPLPPNGTMPPTGWVVSAVQPLAARDSTRDAERGAAAHGGGIPPPDPPDPVDPIDHMGDGIIGWS
ncbi:hypothetical protein T484DRAFT_1952283 [Baffinella frigidus]|nr:hypothetical protein T484DRAFT_1952283 [Cryptophyta sp. CCMP2293]